MMQICSGCLLEEQLGRDAKTLAEPPDLFLGQLPLSARSTSETTLRVPKMSTRSFCLRPCCSIRNDNACSGVARGSLISLLFKVFDQQRQQVSQFLLFSS